MIDVKQTLNDSEEKMEMAALYLEEELNRIRAGRANVAILDCVRVESYGCFVNLFGDCDGLCHVSRLDWERVNHPQDVVKVGQKLKVIVTEIDEKGRVNVSHKEFVEKKPKEKKVESAPLTTEESK